MALVTHSINKKIGKRQVTGNKTNLSKSAEYPVQFGLAVAALIGPHGVPESTPERGSSSPNTVHSQSGRLTISYNVSHASTQKCSPRKLVSWQLNWAL